MQWSEFFCWARDKSPSAIDESKRDVVRIFYSDGSYAEIKSEFEGDYSDLTPGEGVQPPTVRAWLGDGREIVVRPKQ